MMSRKILLLSLCILFTAVTSQAQSFRRLMNNANKNYEIHNYNLAIEGYLQALEKRQDDIEALSRLANSYRMLNMMDEAAQYFNRVVRDRNGDPTSMLLFGHTLKALSRYDEARQWYQLYANQVNSLVGNHYVQSCDFAKAQLDKSGNFQVKNELINTPFSDFAPTFAGQQQVVFSSARTDLSSGGSFDGRAINHLFVSNLTPDQNLGVPYLLRNGYQAENNLGVAPVAYSPDGTMVAFTKNNFVNGRRQIPAAGMELRLFMAQVNPSGQWVDARPFAFNGADFNTGYASFSPDGQALYFSSDRSDGFGGYDIYVSYRVGNSWSTPENMGPIVNSAGNEITPYFDGRDLYFASDWHAGLGGFDIFRAEESGGRWTQIFHLGALVNSSRDDYGYIFDNARNAGYMVSNRPSGSGNEDVYSVRRAANNIVLLIRNASDGLPVSNAVVDFAACGEGAFQADALGEYSFQAVQGLNCNLVVSKDGYFSSTVPITADGLNQEREIIVNLNKVNEAYSGKVVDYTRRVALPNVRVRAVNRSSGSVAESITDINGDYYVALSPYTTYDLSFSAVGYQDYQFALPVDDGRNPDILGVISMLPSNVPGNPSYPNAGGGTTTNPGTGTGTTTGTVSGYAVQVAALGQAATDRFSNIADLGQVYAVQDGNRYKIRLGVYASKEEANQALASAKSRGYQGAFIVREEGVSTGQPPVSGGNTETPKTPNTSAGLYKVQLAAYRNPQYFDADRVSGLGTVESMKKGEFTVMMIGGLYTLEEARQARTQARSSGFPGAFVLVNENGNLRKVE